MTAKTDDLRIDFCMTLRIKDEAAFRQAAYVRALEELGGDETQASEYLDEDLTSIGQCAIMLLDPGSLQPHWGAEIQDSHAESF
ncbi:hypothetical protein [Achromobacter sp. AGC39]